MEDRSPLGPQSQPSSFQHPTPRNQPGSTLARESNETARNNPAKYVEAASGSVSGSVGSHALEDFYSANSDILNFVFWRARRAIFPPTCSLTI